MSTTYWISTPPYTGIVTVNAAGRIVDAAPILRRAWLRHTWQAFHRAHQRWYGLAYRFEVLPAGEAPHEQLTFLEVSP